MKNILYVILAISICALSVQAQEPPQQPIDKVVFGGVIYDSDLGTYGKQLSGRMGMIVPIEGAFCFIPNWEFGKTATLSTEVGAIWNLGTDGKLKLGLLAGPGASWVRQQDSTFIVENNFVNYVTGAAGGIMAYRFGQISGLDATWGGWAAAKYVASLSKNDLYKDGVVAGVGLYLSF